MKVGDLVKYMSRIILIIDKVPREKAPDACDAYDCDVDEWVYGIECGETEVGMYRKSVLKVIA